MKGSIRCFVLLTLLALCLGACGKPTPSPEEPPAPDLEGNVEQTPQETPETPEVENPEEEPAAEKRILARGQRTDYVIVCDDGLSQEAMATVRAFRVDFWRKTRAELSLLSDTEEPRAREILIGPMDGRSEPDALLTRLEAPGKNGYYIGFSQDRLVVACRDEFYLASALSLLVDAIQDLGDGSFGLRADFCAKLDIPTPTGYWGTTTQTYYTGAGNYTVNVQNVKKQHYLDYCALLGETMERYSENQIGENLFATYVADNDRGRMAVWTMYYPKDACYKITYGVLDYLPDLTETATGGGAVTPSITQNARVSGGMSSIVQLSDGRFLIFDGGTKNATDQQSLYALLKSMTPNGGEPVIACWFFTHAHVDHMSLAVEFLGQYHDGLTLEMVAHNFPDFDKTEMVNEDPMEMKIWVTRLYDTLKSHYPDTRTWVVHTGERIRFPSCELEVLYTPEDYSTNTDLGAVAAGKIRFPWGNHTCVTYRMTVNETTFLVLGDSEKTLCQWMGENYTTALKSDILSLSHHGLNGGELNCYRQIDPDVCFWPTNRATKESERCTKYDYNQYLLNINGMGTRDREHYCTDGTKTVYC